MKINKEKYTFVITAYNIEKYLTPCMNSILAQTNTHFKIILVDDGSTDATAQLCDNYAKKHSNISVIHKKNGGASSARNAGIKAVKTDYIIFVDGDDFWDDKYALENINNEISKYQPDILCFSGKSFYEDSNKYINMRYSFPEKMNNMSPEESFNYQVTHDLYTPCPWLKVIKKEFLIKNKLYFIEGIRAEDIEWGFRMINCLPNYKFLNEQISVYRQRNSSVTHTMNDGHLKNYLWIIQKYVDYNFDNRIKKSAKSYLAFQYMLLLAHSSKISKEEKKDFIKELKKYQYLFKYNINPRVNKISKIYNIFGFNITRFLLCNYLKRK